MNIAKKIKTYKWLQLFIFFLVLLFTLQIMCIPASAATTVDFTQKGSLAITEGNSTLSETSSGIVINIYKVGSFDSDALAVYYILTEVFSVSGVAINNLSTTAQNIAAVNKLTAYIKSENIQSTASITTGTDGTAVFSELDLGLYLVTASASPNSNETVSSSPFLVSVPFSDSDNWTYNVTAHPKCTVKKTPPNLPQTGQETLYIYILAGAGVLLIILGFLVVAKRRKDNVKSHEK